MNYYGAQSQGAQHPTEPRDDGNPNPPAPWVFCCLKFEYHACVSPCSNVGRGYVLLSEFVSVYFTTRDLLKIILKIWFDIIRGWNFKLLFTALSREPQFYKRLSVRRSVYWCAMLFLDSASEPFILGLQMWVLSCEATKRYWMPPFTKCLTFSKPLEI